MDLPIPNSTLALNIFSSLNINFVLGQILRISFHQHLILRCVIKNVDLLLIKIWFRPKVSQIRLLVNILNIHLTSQNLRRWCVMNVSLGCIISPDKPSALHIEVPFACPSLFNDRLAPLPDRWPCH